MKNLMCSFAGVLTTAIALPVYANNLSIGDANSTLGELTLSGQVRAKWQDSNYGSSNDRQVKLNAIKVDLDYQSANKVFGHAEYRCYQFHTLCDFSALVDGYLGYQLNPTNHIKIGLQDIPFGPGRFWDSGWFGGIGTSFGLEDTHDLGINYHTVVGQGTNIDVGYFSRDGGQYVGKSADAARFSTNFVKPDNDDDSHIKEKNMLVGRLSQNLPPLGRLKTNLGGSYLLSQLDNRTIQQTGRRQAWSLFSTLNYDKAKLTLTGGHTRASSKDVDQPDYAVMGSFDGAYHVANKGAFYTADLSYLFNNVGKIGNILPYLTYSSFVKDNKAYKTSTRHIAGVEVDHNNITLAAEYVFGKNDPGLGGTDLAESIDSKQYHVMQLLFVYKF